MQIHTHTAQQVYYYLTNVRFSQNLMVNPHQKQPTADTRQIKLISALKLLRHCLAPNTFCVSCGLNFTQTKTL